MRNCLVMGSGRSGTSLLAGTVVRAGYYAGTNLHEPRASNPRGFYEDAEVNSINEQILEPLAGGFAEGHGWLAALPLDTRIPPVDEDVEAAIEWHIEHAPYCYKDPRFCYTLDAWRPYLGDAALLCVFRPPLVTARSIVDEVGSQEYLAPAREWMTEERALEIWIAMYSWVLERQTTSGEWLFLHYDQLLDGSGIDRLERVLGTRVDRDFPDAALNRTRASGDLPAEAAELYGELCRLARYDAFAPA